MDDFFKEKFEKRFEWLNINAHYILYLNQSDASEDEFIACAYHIRTMLEEFPVERDLRFLVNLKNVRFTPKMVYQAMQLARYGSQKVTKRGAIGFSPEVAALFRIARLYNPKTRVFKTYEEAIEYLSG